MTTVITQPEKTQPGIYHIHLDTKMESPELHARFQNELGFFAHHFEGHPEGRIHFEPTGHSSKRILTQDDFKKVWADAFAIVEQESGVIGYLEGEYIPTDLYIPQKPVTQFFKPHFSINRRTLSSALGEKFRETEFHLVMDFDNSDQQVINSLLDAGLYGALLPKDGWRAIVLTIQGHNRFIKPLIEEITWYLKVVGGAARCTIKEEVAL